MEKEQYEYLIKELVKSLQAKDTKILLQEFEINDLKAKLAEAEHHLNPTSKKPETLEIR